MLHIITFIGLATKCSVQVKAKLYSNFVKSGTLTGGKMEEVDEGDSGFVEDKVRCFFTFIKWVFVCFISFNN